MFSKIPPGLLVAGAILLGLTAFSVVCALDWMKGRVETSKSSRKAISLGAIGVGFLVLGFRLWIAEGRVSWAPYLDQWHSEIGGIVAPLAHGTLNWRHLTAASNEHRVILTRAVTLASVALNGEWDNRIEVLVTFLLQSATVAWVSALAWSAMGWTRGTCVCIAAILPMMLVCDWENIVSGFQTQFCFMVLGSIVAFSLSTDFSTRSPAGWGALAIAVLMLGSMASGLLTALTMALTGLISMFVTRRDWRSTAGFCAACIAIAAVGWLTRADYSPGPFLQAQNASACAQAFFAYAAWPLPPTIAGFICLWMPWGVLLGRTLARREMPPVAPFVLALGSWVLLQALALAWGRAGLSGLVGARYTEVLSWGFVANTVALLLLWQAPISVGRVRLAAWVILPIWLAGVGGGELWRSHKIYQPYFTNFRLQTLEHEVRLGAFMRTGDARVITDVKFPHIPGSAAGILRSLRDPDVRTLLPAAMRSDQPPSGLSSMQGGPLSLSAIQALRCGPWFVAGGVAMLFVAALLALRSSRAAPQDRAA
jgi:hypothetical protein